MTGLTVAATTPDGPRLAGDDIFTPETNPLAELRNTVVFGSKDWGNHHSDAWMYGIVVGWDLDDDPEEDPDGEVMASLADKFGWDDATIARLRALHAEYVRLSEGVPR